MSTIPTLPIDIPQITDAEAERQAIAAIASHPDVLDLLDTPPHPDIFPTERATLEAILTARAAGDAPPSIPSDWQPTTDLDGILRRLRGVHQRQQLAGLAKYIGNLAFNDTGRDPADIAREAMEAAAEIHGGLASAAPIDELRGDALVHQVLADAADRAAQYTRTGQPVMGLRTGLPSLDKRVNGMEPGLHLLGAGPGMGKTTFANQIGKSVAAAEAPIIYISYENVPTSLMLKLLCGEAGIDTQIVRRGQADTQKLRDAARSLAPILPFFTMVRGTSALTTADIRATARRAMARCNADQCLVVVDYLQLMAKSAAAYRDLGSVRERVEVLGGELREVAISLNSPLLAIVSLNREGGNYGGNNGGAKGRGKDDSGKPAAPNMDAMKESGDLEYAADAVYMLGEGNAVVSPGLRSLNLYIRKCREGDADGRPIPLIFNPSRATFREEDWQHGR